MHYPGDEGNLVQSAETLKPFWLMAGVSTSGSELCITPKLPWACEPAEITDTPVPLPHILFNQAEISKHWMLFSSDTATFAEKVIENHGFDTVCECIVNEMR